jgi:hypothetical protein
LNISGLELDKTEHSQKITALERRITMLEERKKENASDAIGVGFEDDALEDKKPVATLETVAEVLQEKHNVLSDHVIGIVNQLTQKVGVLEKVVQLKEERSASQTVAAPHFPWHRSLLNVVTASSFFVSGLYYSKAAFPFFAKALAVGGPTVATAVPYLYMPAAGLSVCRIAVDIYADYKKASFDTYKKSWQDYFRGSSLWRNHSKPTKLFMGSAIICKALVNNCRAVGKTLTKILVTAGVVNMLVAVGVGAAMIAPSAGGVITA